MSVNPVAPVGAGAPAAALQAADVAAPQTFDVLPNAATAPLAQSSSGSSVFHSMLSAVNQLNTELIAGDQAVRNIAVGNVDNLHQSMMAMEHAKLSLELMLQVRSRMLDAYEEIMRMQI